MFYKIVVLAGMIAAISSNVWSQDDSYNIVIKNHVFSPSSLEIPANKKVKLIIDNQDSNAAEFESFSLNREKIVKGNSKAIIFIGPLKSGTYDYFDDFNRDAAKGLIIVK